MMRLKERKKFIPFRKKFNEATQKVLFCEKVRVFISESHKCQTLYANCEGSYPRRVGSCQEKKLLEEFIFSSMYCNDYCEEQLQSDSDKRMNAKQICDEMILLSKKYNADDEIHFSVIWVYYYEYDREIINTTPVFKIFKKRTGSEAVFLDVFLKFYESWDCYLENAEFVESFLCVPRHGEYCFDSESNMLVLEYMLSMKLKTNDSDCIFDALPKRPFSQKMIRPLFTIINSSKDKMVEQILQLLHTMFSYWNERKEEIFKTAIFITLAWIRIKRCRTNALTAISNYAFMLLNRIVETDNYSDILNFQHWSKHFMTLFSEFLAFSDVQKAITEVSKEGTYFFELLLNREKDWLEILKSFCSLFKNSRPVLILVLDIAPDLLIIKHLLWLLRLAEIISENVNCQERVYTDQKLENRNLEISSLGLLAPNMSNWSAFEMSPSSVDFETQVDIRCSRALHGEVLLNLPSLETVSMNAAYNLLLEKLAKFDEKVQPRLTCPAFCECEILVGKQDGYGIYLFPRASMPRLFSSIGRLLKTNFYYKSRGIFTTEIISSSGKSLGFIFFPLEFSALGLFPLEALEKEENSLKRTLESQ